MIVESVALLVLGVCLVWMIRAPGIQPLVATLIVFFIWVSVRIARSLTRKLRIARDRVAKNLKDVLPEAWSEQAQKWVGLPSEATGLGAELAQLTAPDFRIVTERLKPYLYETDRASSPVAHPQALEAGSQLLRLSKTLDRFHEILGSKLSPNELTFDRYARIAVAARETLLGQLTETANRIDARAPLPEIKQLLDRNQAVLTQLDQTNLALSRIQGISRDREQELEHVLEDLRRLEDRARSRG